MSRVPVLPLFIENKKMEIQTDQILVLQGYVIIGILWLWFFTWYMSK